uniref:V-ATPase 14 kDa subunit n=1 Tax=Bos indicus x Bos taurus TaxID=30522 RepID=A0A4W2E4Q5_BOBOX
MAGRGKLIAVIRDEDTVTGFLLGGIGELNKNRHPNFLVVEKDTTINEIEDTFRQFLNRDDIGIILINQYIAEMVRRAAGDGAVGQRAAGLGKGGLGSFSHKNSISFAVNLRDTPSFWKQAPTLPRAADVTHIRREEPRSAGFSPRFLVPQLCAASYLPTCSEFSR